MNPVAPDIPPMFSDREEERLSQKTVLDDVDRKILAQILIHPKWSNEEIGEEIGLNRIQVWRRRTKGPLAVVLMEFQKEALHGAMDLIIQEARGSVAVLGQLARGECDCGQQIKEQAENHRLVCLTPVPYAVRRQAAKDLVEILMNKPKAEKEEGDEEVWVATVTEVGSISARKLIGGPVVDIVKEES